MSKEILELLKGLLKKIISHLDLPEPKGVHPQVEEERVKKWRVSIRQKVRMKRR